MNRRKLLSGLSATVAALLVPLKGRPEDNDRRIVLDGVPGAYFPKDWKRWTSVDAITVLRICACGHDSYVRYDWARQEIRYLPDYPKEDRCHAIGFQWATEDLCYDCYCERLPK